MFFEHENEDGSRGVTIVPVEYTLRDGVRITLQRGEQYLQYTIPRDACLELRDFIGALEANS